MQQTKPKHIYAALGALALITFIGILNETSMNVTYPELASLFHVSLDVVQWITTGYLLMVTITMGTTAYLLRQFTARRLHLVAVTAFIVGAVLSAMAVNFPMLLIGRLIQSVATGLATPILFHLIFWLLLPLALISLVDGQLYIRNRPLGNDQSFSYGSLITLALSLFAVVYACSTIGKSGFGLLFWGLLVAAVICFGLFIYINNHGHSQLFDLTVFKVKPLRLSTLTYFSLQFINIGISLVIPLYAQYVLHTSATVAGLILLPGSVLGAFLAPLAGRLADEQGFRRPVTFGGTLLLVGTACFAVFQHQLTAWWMMLFFVILRAGFNFAFGNTISNASVLVEQRNSSDVNSIFNMVQQFAGSLGTGLLASVIALTQQHSTGSLAQRTFVGGRIDYLLLTAPAVVVVIAIVTNYRWQRQLSKTSK